MSDAKFIVDHLLESVLTPLRQVMLDLDCALTGKPPAEVVRQYHHYPADVLKWLEEPGGDPVWYLSDSGYSRVVWHPYERYIELTYNSTPPVVARWEAAAPQREAALAYLNGEFDRLQAEMPKYESQEDMEKIPQPTPERLSEAAAPTMKRLKQHRVELDDAERKLVMKRGAVWHHGKDGKPTPAVWKAELNGRTYYVCNTHRAAAIKKSLKAAIRAFDFIETTA